MLIGIWLIAVGVLRVVAAFEVDENRGWNIFAGAVELLAGIVIVSDPNIGFATLALLVGLGFILNGMGMFAVGWSLHTLRACGAEAPRQPRAERTATMIDPFAGLPVAVLSESRTLFEAGLILVLAAAAPLIAQVLRLPSILVLLALGFGAGAIGALDPDALLGENLISTVVSIAVGIILFEAGLGLNFSKLTGSVARVYSRLVSLGILVTWAVGTVAAYLLFDLSLEVALVLGAVLVVSGPTVVGPLLSFIRPSKTVNSVLKWEGTFADPIGATLGVVVFNAVIAGHAKAGEEIAQFLLAIGIGAGFGIAGGVLVLAWARWFRPSQSQAVTGTLMFVVAMVVCADLLRDDTGLITGLFMGAILVNRPPHGIEPEGLAIQTAKLTRAWRERIATLSTFLIGILFIILSARVSPHQIGEIGWVSLAFIGVLVLVGRPLAVGLSTLGSALAMRERAFIAWMAPRGIVAAATSSTFALGLTEAGVGGGAQNLIPITFIVIVATALIYGLSGAPWRARSESRAQARVGCCWSALPRSGAPSGVPSMTGG